MSSKLGTSGRNDDDDDDDDDQDEERRSARKWSDGSDHPPYEWEEELEEYDEPDIYPSEKDYKWFEEIVTDSEEEPEIEQETTAQAEEGTTDKTETTTVPEEASVEGKQTEGETQPATESAKEGQTAEGDEGAEDGDEFVPNLEIGQDEPEEDLAPKKKYKTIQVRRLVERPPKIYHLADNIRINESMYSDDDFPVKSFTFLHSFGYDCQRLGNLIVLDNTTLLFMSGFVLTFYNHKKLEKSYMRSLGGGSFGSIALHPSRKLFAAAEKGSRPLIGIWSWPKLDLFRILSDGTEMVYASVNFSPDGKLLASQGGEPDYLITVWNWLAEAPILRVKSHVQDVYRVTFAKELAGLLTTSGLCHIKFWKMAGTFTGLKLKGDVGRFGRTEISDIEGYVEMSDGKVLSGTEWGNLLVWENGLVIAELCMANHVPCHVGIVRQILMVEGDFFTTGQDGRIKVWRYEDVDTAEIHTTNDNLKVAMKAVTNVIINEEGDIWSIFQDPYNNDDVSVFWFAQDGRGFIWLVDLSFLNIAKEPKVVLTAHGGPILDSAMSPAGLLIATIGDGGKIIIHDYITKELVAIRGFSAPGSCLLWPSHGQNFGGFMLIAGFGDGVVRIMLLSSNTQKDETSLSICLQLVYKPHRSRVNSIALDSGGEYLVSGSDDGTLFLFNAAEGFMPLCYIEMPDRLPIKKVLWSKMAMEQKIFFAICQGAVIQEIEMPTLDEIDNTLSYCFKDPTLLRNCTVKSIKSVLRHNEELNRIQQEEEEKQAAIERENQRLVDDGIETQDEQNARLLEEALELDKARAQQQKKEKKWEPYIPPQPSPILEAFQDHLDPDVFHLTLGNYDSGYIYSIRLMSNDAKRVVGASADEPFNAVPVVDSNDVPISKLVFINNGSYLLTGFEDGRVRLSHLMYDFELESIKSHYTMGAHDVVRGNITSISFNREETIIFTTGMDGNCFMYSLVDDEELHNSANRSSVVEYQDFTEPLDIRDITSADAYTLEDSKNVEKERAILAAARKSKAAKREKIAQLRFRFAEILNRNNELPAEVRLTAVELSVASDNAIRNKERSDQALENLNIEMAWHCEYVRLGLEKVKSFFVDRLETMLFVIKAFRSSFQVSSFRLSNYPDFFEDAKMKLLKGEEGKNSVFEHPDEEVGDASSVVLYLEPRPKRKRGMDKFIHQKMVRLWERRQKKLIRKKEWDDFMQTDPSEKELVDEMAHIHDAQNKIGDMKLKIDPNYKVPSTRRLTVRNARRNLIFLEDNMFNLQKNFNDELISLRNIKIKVLEKMKDYSNKIGKCQSDIPSSKHLNTPSIPKMTVEEDPQAILNYTREDVLAFQSKRNANEKNNSIIGGTGIKKSETHKRRRRSWNALKNENEEEIKPSPVEVIPVTPSALELEIETIKSAQAEFYQKYYIECIEKEMFMFDAKLKIMRHKKVKLDYDLKIAEARMINLTQEFILAQKSFSMEVNLEYIVKESTKEKRVCTTTMKTLQKGIDSYKAQIELNNSKKNALLKEVQEIATNALIYEKYLIRVFRKKINLNKVKKSAAEDDDSGDDSDDSDDSDDMDMMGDEDDDEDDLDVDLPPQDLKPWIYEAVVEVRNRRLALDESEIKTKASMDELISQGNGFRQRMNIADNTLQKTQQELEKFNLEKQNKLNSMEAAVSLNQHQLHYLHTHLDEALVINTVDIRSLEKRIPELQKEKKVEKKRVLTTKNEYRRLLLEDKKFKQRLEEYDSQCDKEMLLKFGKVKPVEELEYFQEDPEITKIKKDLRDMQARHEEMVRSIQRESNRLFDDRSVLIKEQREKLTVLLEMNEHLADTSMAMEAGLNIMPQKVDDDTGSQEILRMQQIVLHQAEIIRHLKQQIMSMTSTSFPRLPPIGRKQ